MMKKKMVSKPCLIALSLITWISVMVMLPFGKIIAQQNAMANDLEIWSAVGIKYEISKRLDLKIEEQLRLKEDGRSIDNFFFQAGLVAKLHKMLDWGFDFRQIRENDDRGKIQGYENHYRINSDLEFKHEIKRFTYRIRARIQQEQEIAPTANLLPEREFRLRGRLDYNIRNWKLDPELTGEWFNSLNDENYPGWTKYRLTIGTEYSPGKHEISFLYGYEGQFNREDPRAHHIISISYFYNLN